MNIRISIGEQKKNVFHMEELLVFLYLMNMQKILSINSENSKFRIRNILDMVQRESMNELSKTLTYYLENKL